MPTNLNTERIITTLREPPCNWTIIASSDIYAIGGSVEGAASMEIRNNQATMQAVFSPDLPEHIAVRNMNYLLVFVAAAGAKDAIPWILDIVNANNRLQYAPRNAYDVHNQLFVNLQIDKQRSLTTVTIRPRKARVYESTTS